MSSHPGTYSLGPDNATLRVKTGRTGAAAKAGHNLDIVVGAWSAQLELGDTPEATKLSLDVDSRSLKVRGGSGGVQSLGEEDRANIEQTIATDVFKGREISFRSTAVSADADGGLHVRGDFNLLGNSGPLDFRLAIGEDGHFSGAATVVQTKYGLKPYSALFGTLKLADAVEVSVDGTLPL